MPEEIIIAMIVVVVGTAVLVAPVCAIILTVKMGRRMRQVEDRLWAFETRLVKELGSFGDLLRRMHSETPAQEPGPAPEPTQQAEPQKQEAPKEPSKPEPDIVQPIPIVKIKQPPTPPPSPSVEVRPVPQAALAVPEETVKKKRTPNRFEAAAIETLRKIWDWLAVRGEFRPEGVNAEYAIATNWLVRIGVIILVAGIGFFLKYSIDQGWVPPIGRVSLSMITGVVMVVGGIRILDGRYQVLGQGLMGGGLATMYFSVFAAANFHHLITFTPAFLLMAVITVGAGGMAVRFNSLLIAVLGIIGGYGTPIMLKAASISFPRQFTYLLFLGAGTLGVSWKKDWRLLNYLSFIGTCGLVGMSLDHYTVAHFAQVMPFLVAFFVLFTTMTFLYNVVNGKTSTVLELIELGLSSAAFFFVGRHLIAGAYSREWVAALTLGVAAYYVGHIYWFLLRRNRDRGLLLSFIALAAFFVTITMPIVLSDSWITVSWAIQALIMLWIANKLNSEFLRSVAFFLYAVVLWRFCFLDLNRQYFHVSSPTDMLMGEYLMSLLERLIVFGVPIGSLAGAYRLLQRPGGAVEVAVDKANDIKAWIEGSRLGKVIVVLVAGMVFLYLHLELNRTFLYMFDPIRLPVLTLLWLALCGLALVQCLNSDSRTVRAVLAVLACAVILKLLFVDLVSWELRLDHFVYAGDYSFLHGTMRLLDFGIVIGFLVAAWRFLCGTEHTRTTAVCLGNVAVALLFLFFTLELNTFLGHFVPDLQPGGISILWSVFALTFIVTGILRDICGYRYLGLGLFALVALKVTFVDLKDLSQLYRIVAFITLGVLVLTGSFAYLTFRQRFGTDTETE